MKILFDARHLSLPYTGLGRYVYQLLLALLRSNLDHEVTVLLSEDLRPPGNPLRDGLMDFLSLTPGGIPTRIEYVTVRPFSINHHLRMAGYVNNSGCDLYFFPNFDPPLGLKVPYSFVVYDLYPLVLPDYILNWRLPKLIYYKSILARALAGARNVICISGSTRDDLVKIMARDRPDLAAKAIVVGTGPCLPAWSGAKITPEIPYLLYVGDRRPHKNLMRMVDTFMELRRNHGYKGEFHMVGSPRNFDLDLDAYVLGKEGIRLIANVDDQALNALYAGCEALFFLSRYEGFGMPILEAAQHDCKIITSNNSALGEVAPPGALKLDPYGTPEVLAESIAAYLRTGNPDYGNYKERYTWDNAALEIFDFRSPDLNVSQ
jgi:glycosyltransferase involved in cell wall biosynthesis